ncbi:MAG: alpha/beta hydrolase [Bacteroidetes bacterium]|nr:MAG: alpha/beta hydrolase [Bacteroidota bacterium]
MKKLLICLLLTSILAPLVAQNQILPLWQGDPPNYRETGEVTIWDTADIVRVRNVQKPDIAVFLPSKKNASGEAVVICPGGGYGILAYDWEGSDIARWLNSRGIAAFVLKYRLPGSKSNVVPHKSPLMDAQRAMRIVRSNAAVWNIDPGKIGIMGFSAGGHLASTLSTHFDAGDSSNPDPVEQVSCKPDFSVLVYPVISFTEDFQHSGSRINLLGEDADEELVKYYSNELQVTADTPPAILIHSDDDKGVPVENSIAYYKALRANKVSSELHIYPYGGHGYSLAIGKGHLATWPDRVIEWIHYIYQ